MSVASVAGGWAYYQFFWPRIEGLTWEIVVVEGKPVLKVDFRTNVYPVVVRLLNAEKRVVDEVEVSIPEDIPVLLRLPVMMVSRAVNVFPGTYYVRLIHKDKVLAQEPVEVVIGLEVTDVKFATKYEPILNSWLLTGLTLTIKNTGTAPVSFDMLHIGIGRTSYTIFLERVVFIDPGKEQEVSAQETIEIGPSGTYNVVIRLDLGVRVITHKTPLTVG